MYKNKKIVAVIPARGGSKGILRKNVKLLNGKPLVFYSIQASLKSKYIDRTIISTEDNEVAKISKECGAEVIERPKDLTKDNTPTVPVIRHAVDYLKKKENYSADIVVILQPTSPLREVSDIDSAIEKFWKSDADLVVSVCETKHHPFWSFEINGDKLTPFIKNGFKITKRQDLPKLCIINGAVYVIAPDTLKKDNIFTGDMRAIIMDEERSIDIDTLLDFKIAALLIKEREKWKK